MNTLKIFSLYVILSLFFISDSDAQKELLVGSTARRTNGQVAPNSQLSTRANGHSLNRADRMVRQSGTGNRGKRLAHAGRYCGRDHGRGDDDFQIP